VWTEDPRKREGSAGRGSDVSNDSIIRANWEMEVGVDVFLLDYNPRKGKRGVYVPKYTMKTGWTNKVNYKLGRICYSYQGTNNTKGVPWVGELWDFKGRVWEHLR